MDTERKETCGKRIRKALTIRAMKQSELCQFTNIPKSAMSQYISGSFEPKQDRIYLIAKALNVSEAWLMGYEVPMERQSNISIEKNLPQDKSDLSKEEKILLDLFNCVPEEKQKLVIEMIRVALENLE